MSPEAIEPDEWRLPERANEPYDAPDAVALIEAVWGYLHDELMPRSQGADRWLIRIAANALRIAGREMSLGPVHRAAHTERLAALGVASDRELSEAIRSGDLDDRWDEVMSSVRASVADSLTVANPGYAHP